MTNVTITGTPRAGYTLTAVVDPATSGTFEWEGAGASSTDTYVVQATDAGENVKVTFTYPAPGEPDGKRRTDRVEILPLETNDPRGDFTLNGKEVGEEIGIEVTDAKWPQVMARDNFEASAKTYQWSLDGNPIAGATSETYTPVSGDAGGALTLRIDYVDGLGNAKYVASKPETVKG